VSARVGRPGTRRGPASIVAALTLVVAGALPWADASPDAGRPALVVAAALLVVAVLAVRVRLWASAARAPRGDVARRPPGASPTADGRRAASGALIGLGGVALALLAVQAVVGISFWALVLLAAGALVLWSQVADPRVDEHGDPTGWQRLVGLRPRSGAGDRSQGIDLLLPASGVALVVLGSIVGLASLGALDASRTGVLQTTVVIVAVLVVAAPFWRRMVRATQRERAERIRGDERAEVAAHLHDSVLQTLALIQRQSDDPREVQRLARRQERELRTWLSGRSERPDDELMAALRATAAAIELEHGADVEVVTSGERALDDRTVALVAAAREAMTNAARHAAGSPVSVFAEADGDRIEVFVRDRGPGFDPAATPPDRRGVRESIVGRMRRAGGRATIHSVPGEGTEVELLMEDRA